MALTKSANRMISGASVNVLDFGAKGDGTTDDGPAIQLAINSLPNGGTVLIPDGEFLISTNVSITKGIRVLGAGRVNFNGYTSSGTTSHVVAASSSPQTVFTYPFVVPTAADVAVYKNNVLLTYGSDYSIQNMGNVGGTITLTSGATTNQIIAITTQLFQGSTLIRVSDGVTAFSFNKGNDIIAFGCSIEQMSFASTAIAQSTYNGAPIFKANTHAINMSHTAELVLDRLDFMNLDKCIFTLEDQVTVKPFIEDMTAKDCNYFLKTEDAAADFTVTNLSLIKMNYGIHTTSLDGLVMSNATIYRSYVSAMYDVGGGVDQISNFINISNCHFFESGSTLCYFHSISQLTITGCDFVRAGLVTDTVQTGLLIYNSEVVSVSGGMIERCLGDGAQVYGNRFVDFATNIMSPGYTKGSRTGLVAYDNQSINVDCNITCVGVNAAAAANFQNSKSVSGVITSDDIVIGRTETLVQRGVTEYVQCLTFPSVVGASGNVNLAVNIPYFLNGNINSVGALSGQSLVVYEIEFPTGGSTTGVEGLTFRVNGPTQTFNNYIVAAPPSSPTVFAYTFTANSDSSIAVYKNGTLLTLTTDYTVSGAGSPGGNITLTSPAAVGDYIWAGPRNDEIGDFSTVLDSSGRMEFRKQIDYNITGGNISDTFSLYLFNNPSSGLGSFTIAPGSIIKVKYKVCEYAIATY